MYNVGDIVDDKYVVTDVCSDSGGMGRVLLVRSTMGGPILALKYCRENSPEEWLRRFRREVRVLAAFAGNSKIVQIVDHSLEHNPPYFVMRYYADGDLNANAARVRASAELQERIFLQMMDGIQELHSRNEFHRDIKPANFLMEGDQVVVSDFGLTTEIGENMGLTRSSMWAGTPGYLPPEFLDEGGFKRADAAADIFMLGKTMYAVLTGRDPMYIAREGVSTPVFHVIQRACSVSRTDRYSTIAELKQSLVSAYDVVLGRAGGIGKAKQLLVQIADLLQRDRQFVPESVIAFVEQLALLDRVDQAKLLGEVPEMFFGVFSHPSVIASLPAFLAVYESMVESQEYSWSYAEIIARNMRAIFMSPQVPVAQKGLALDLAMRAADYMNRFAAMDTCVAMIKQVAHDEVAFEVAAVIRKHRAVHFVQRIEASECNSMPVRLAIKEIAAT